MFLLICSSESDQLIEENQTPSSQQEIQEVVSRSQAMGGMQDEKKIRNILVDIKILRLQNVLLEQQLEERSQQIASLKRKLNEASHAGHRNTEREQKIKELILNLEAQSLKFREESLKNSEEILKKDSEIEVNFG